MKTSVRFISLLLAIFMLAGMAITVSANDTLVAAAPDTTGDEAMAFLKAVGIMVGDENKNMNPEGFLKRSEVAKLIYVLKTSFTEAEETNTDFIDVDDGHWASGYINALNVMGVIGGYGDGTFGPDDYVTGDQLAKMLLGVLGVSEFDSKLWPSDVRASAKKYDMFETLSKLTLSENIKRRHAAQMIYNIFDEVIEDAVTGKKYTLTSFFGVETVDALVSRVGYMAVDPAIGSVTDKPVSITLLSDSVQLNAAAGDVIALKSGVICNTTDAHYEKYFTRIVEIYLKDGEIIGHAIKPNKTVDGFKLNEEETALDYEDEELVINANTVWLNPQLNRHGVGSGHYQLAESITVSGVALSSKPSDADLINIAKHAHKALIVDNNDDGVVDYIIWDIIARYELQSVSSSGFTFVANPHYELNGNTYRAINKHQVSGYADITNNTEEIIAHAFYGRLTKLAPEIKEGVVTAWNDKKVTIDGATYELNRDVFKAGDATYAGFDTAECVGEKFKAYAYNGIVYKSDRVYSEDDLVKFALLLYVEEPVTPEYDMTTHTFSKSFSAVVSMAGRDKRVPITQETYDHFVSSRIETPTDDPATVPFIKAIDENGYLVTYPTLVTYTVDEDGLYTLTDNANADGTPVNATISTGRTDEVYNLYAGATIKRDDLLWTAFDNSNNEIVSILPANKVDTIIDTNSQIFYQYTKDETGGEDGHKHYGMLTVAEAKKLSKNASDKNAFEGILYGQFNEAGDFFYVIAAYIEEVKYHEAASSSATKNFRADGRQIVYAHKQPVQALSDDGESVAYAHAFKNITTNTNKADEVVNVVNDPADTIGGAASVKYGFYGYDEATETYYKLDATTIGALGATSINVYTFQKVFNNCLFATGGNGDLVDGVSIANAKIYKVRASYANTFTAITIDEIKEEAKDGTLGELIVITYKDSKGNTQISAIIANHDNKSALNEFKTPSAN